MINRSIKRISFFTLVCFVFFVGSSGFPVKHKGEKRGVSLLKEGEALYEKFEYEAALAKFLQARVFIKNKQNKIRLYLDLSKVYYGMGEIARTGEILEELFKLDPGKTIDENRFPRGYVSLFNKLKPEVKAKTAAKPVKLDKQKTEVIEKPAVKIKGENGTIEKPGKRKKKKFPTLLVIGGIIVVGILVYFLFIKKAEKYTLTVNKGEGVNGTPESGSTQYDKDKVVNYSYSTQAGYHDLHVLLDGVAVAASGSVKMDRNHSLTATTEELGSIRVESDPGSAAIWLDGVDTGKRTTATLTNVAPGDHIIKLVKSGYYDWEESVTVTAGEQAAVNASLLKEVKVTWVSIPAGSFKMGDNFDEGYSYEQPVHTVYLDAYYISKYEVTFIQYDAFCDDTGRTKPDDNGWGRENRPVINVSWEDAKAFCKWLSSKTGYNIHLPTEAQWEKAARGTDQRRYPWGNGTADCSNSNYRDCGGETKEVGSHPSGASPYGVHDMAGNVWEWCSDWYSSTYYSSSPTNNPTGPSSGASRVRRGGSWMNYAWDLRSSNRYNTGPSGRLGNLGFRLCRD